MLFIESNKSSKTLRITSKDYPGQVFIHYRNIENKLFSIKRLVEYDLSNIQKSNFTKYIK